MEVYACGLNAHHQLLSTQGDETHSSPNLNTFQKVAAGKAIRIIRVLWCATILEIDDQLIFQGYHPSVLANRKIPISKNDGADELISFFGDMSGVVGALSRNGEIQELATNEKRPDELVFETRQEVWLQQNRNTIEHVSIAGNGEVAVVLRKYSSPNGRLREPQCRLPHLSLCPVGNIPWSKAIYWSQCAKTIIFPILISQQFNTIRTISKSFVLIFHSSLCVWQRGPGIGLSTTTETF